MLGHALVTGDHLDERVCYLDALERADAQPLDRCFVKNATAESGEIAGFILDAAAIRTDVDAGEDDFLVAALHEHVDLVDGILLRTRAQRTAGIRDRAIRAELIAALLDLHICTRHAADTLVWQIFVIEQLLVVRHVRRLYMILTKSLDRFHDLVTLVGADDEVHLVKGFQLRFRCLRVAAADNDGRRRIFPGSVADHLARFAVAEMGDGASIDDVDIGEIVKIDDLIAGILKQRRHNGRIVLIDLAAEGMKCHFLGFWQICHFLFRRARRRI